MTRGSNIIPLVALSLTAMMLVPLASADYAPGSTVGKTDSDHSPWAKELDPFVLCYIDPDGSGHYNPGEPLVVHFATTCTDEQVAYEDLLILGLEGPAPGYEVAMDDGEYARSLHGNWTDGNGFVQLEHTLAFIDYTGEGEWSDDNVLYLDLFNVGRLRVDAGDLRITGWQDKPAFSVVEYGDGDVATGLNQLDDPDRNTAAHSLLSDGGDAAVGTASPSHVLYEAGNGLYINGDGDDPFNRTVEKEDVRFSAVPDPLAAASAPAGEPAWSLSGLQAPRDPLEPGQAFTLSVRVENIGEGKGAGLVVTQLGGQVVDARGTPTLSPGEAITLVVMLVAPDPPGSHALSVGTETATVIVEDLVKEEEGIDLSPLRDRIERLEGEVSGLQTRATVQSAPPAEETAPVEPRQETPMLALLPLLVAIGVGAVVAQRPRD